MNQRKKDYKSGVINAIAHKVISEGRVSGVVRVAPVDVTNACAALRDRRVGARPKDVERDLKDRVAAIQELDTIDEDQDE